MKCAKGYELEVLRSNAGYYIGTVDEDSCPYCRYSKRYFKTEAAAQRVLRNIDNLYFEGREDVGNMFCCHSAGAYFCIEVEEE